MGYVINFDRPTYLARIHNSECPYYLENRDVKDPKDGGWSEEFASLTDAIPHAENGGREIGITNVIWDPCPRCPSPSES